jgi:hypothetical protein
LFFRHGIVSFQFLLFPQLDAIAEDPSPHPPVFTWRIRSTFDRAFICQTLATFEEQFCPLYPAITTYRFSLH